MNYQTILTLSGGVSSATLLAEVLKSTPHHDVLCVYVALGLRVDLTELNAASALAEGYGVDLRCVEMERALEERKNPLFEGEVPSDRRLSVPCLVPTIVSLCASLAVSYEASRVALAVCADDRTLPDRKPEALVHLEAAVRHATEGKVKLFTPFVDWTLAQVISHGANLGVPFEKTWSCYKGLDRPCGDCHKCKNRRQAFLAAKVTEPL